MRFAFSDEQRAFQRSVRELLARACPPSHVRAAWSQETRHDALWRALAEVGLLGEKALLVDGAPDAIDAGAWIKGYQFALAGPIYAGTNEIQRNVIAERVLGLPRK